MDTIIGGLLKYLAVALFAPTDYRGSFAAAGSLSDPIFEQDLIIEQAYDGSSGTTILAMMALLLFTATLTK